MRKAIFDISIFTLLALLFSGLSASRGNAKPEFAEKTGRECRACHVDPLGGGPLKDFGRGYLLSLHPDTPKQGSKARSPSRLLRLVIGFVHVVTAFLWFGTILYVHLVLKPAYASKGLPPGEVKVGLVSMAVIAVTGAALTYDKVPSVHILFSSRFGILLVAKIALFTLMVASALYVVLIIGPRLRNKRAAEDPRSGQLTGDELASYDGREGRPAYFAFKGKIYDVSKSGLWREGSHMKRHRAGTDLTHMLSQAPHGEEKVWNMPETGALSPPESSIAQQGPQRIFFFMSYLNLACVFLILLILALWKWSW